MNLENYYWYFKGALTPRFCDDVVKYSLEHRSHRAKTGHQNSISDPKIRSSDIVWLDERWIYNELHSYIIEANFRANWNFECSSSESVQFTKYALNQHYNWHQDSWNGSYNNPQSPNTHGKIRKLSLTASLSDDNEYQGGNLEFFLKNQEHGEDKIICPDIRSKGSVIIFPSFNWHRVQPVTNGTRYSLVMWTLGKPWR